MISINMHYSPQVLGSLIKTYQLNKAILICIYVCTWNSTLLSKVWVCVSSLDLTWESAEEWGKTQVSQQPEWITEGDDFSKDWMIMERNHLTGMIFIKSSPTWHLLILRRWFWLWQKHSIKGHQWSLYSHRHLFAMEIQSQDHHPNTSLPPVPSWFPHDSPRHWMKLKHDAPPGNSRGITEFLKKKVSVRRGRYLIDKDSWSWGFFENHGENVGPPKKTWYSTSCTGYGYVSN